MARIKYYNIKTDKWEYADSSFVVGGTSSDSADLTGYATEKWVQDNYQEKGSYLTEHQDISGKLDADRLPEAINEALAQAKESGKFDGDDYVLTEADKSEIAEMTADLVDVSGSDEIYVLGDGETIEDAPTDAVMVISPDGYVDIPSYGGGLILLDPEEGEVFGVIVPEPTPTGISASYTGGDVVIGTALTALVGIVVTATYSNGTTKTVTDYTLSGSITEGSNTITVTYENMTATFTVTGVAEEPEVTLTSISANYTGGNVAVGTAVTDLTGITVTAHYSDGSTEPVTGYTLSGEIVEGSNTITVSYGGKTTTFTVMGNAEYVNPSGYPVYLENINGVEYFVVHDRVLVDNFLKTGSYQNDTYMCYEVQPLNYAGMLDLSVADPYGGVIPVAEGVASAANLRDYASEGEYYFDSYFRLYKDLGGYADVHDYYWNKYGIVRFALKSGKTRKTIDPSKITSISIKQNDDVWQYAQFNYSDGPTSNIYSGWNTLTFRNGDNANLSNKAYPCVAMTPTLLSIKFKPGTFADFTLDAVKAFLTEHTLTLIY